MPASGRAGYSLAVDYSALLFAFLFHLKCAGVHSSPLRSRTPFFVFSTMFGISRCAVSIIYTVSHPRFISEVKVSAWNAGDQGSIPRLGRSPGEGNGNPLQCSCLQNPMDRGAWWATVCGVSRSWTQLSDFAFTFLCILATSS